MSNILNVLQLTLALLKPHVIKVPFATLDIRERILSEGFLVLRTRRMMMSRLDAEQFYEEHSGKFFYNRLVTFMSSGPIDVHILAREDGIKKWREMMGPTKVCQAFYSAPDSIRASHGLSDTRNATHGSDSPESAAREIKFFFPEFDVDNWFKNEEPLFRSGVVKFDPEKFVHILER